jgi:putative transposase
MDQRKSYKFRLYPTAEQKYLLAKQFGSVRFVFNYFLDLRIKTYEETGKGLTYNQTASMLTELKKEVTWLKEPHSQTLQASLGDLDAAYANFFAGRTSFPKFKSKRGKQSFRYPQGFKFDGKYTYLPKIGWVKTIFHRQLQGS